MKDVIEDAGSGSRRPFDLLLDLLMTIIYVAPILLLRAHVFVAAWAWFIAGWIGVRSPTHVEACAGLVAIVTCLSGSRSIPQVKVSFWRFFDSIVWLLAGWGILWILAKVGGMA